MTKIGSWLSLALVGMACLVLNALPAYALNDRSWVSRAGSDASACTIGAPCLTFSGALAKTNAGGLINCLDAGDFGGGGSGFTITQSITIDCTGTFAGVGGAFFGSGAIGISTGASDVVRLRGLSIEGGGGASYGVLVYQVGALRIEQCKIFGFSENGVDFRVPTGFGSELYVSDSVISENVGGPAAL